MGENRRYVSISGVFVPPPLRPLYNSISPHRRQPSFRFTTMISTIKYKTNNHSLHNEKSMPKSIGLQLQLLGFSLSPCHRATTVARNCYNIISATQDNSHIACKWCNKQTNATIKQTMQSLKSPYALLSSQMAQTRAQSGLSVKRRIQKTTQKYSFSKKWHFGWFFGFFS